MLYRDKKPLIVFLLPSLLLMLVLLYYPFIENIINSFFEIRSLVSPREEFIGLLGWILGISYIVYIYLI